MHESEKWKWSHSVVSDSQWPYGLQPTRFLHPWDFPGKSTGVGCHCLLRLYYQMLSNFNMILSFNFLSIRTSFISQLIILSPLMKIGNSFTWREWWNATKRHLKINIASENKTRDHFYATFDCQPKFQIASQCEIIRLLKESKHTNFRINKTSVFIPILLLQKNAF